MTAHICISKPLTHAFVQTETVKRNRNGKQRNCARVKQRCVCVSVSNMRKLYVLGFSFRTTFCLKLNRKKKATKSVWIKLYFKQLGI